jgi:hypothetical protein
MPKILTPTTGDTFEIQGQAYTVVGSRDHMTRYGRPVTLWVLQAACAECGEAFECAATKTMVHKRKVTHRRCPLHHRPGHRAGKTLTQPMDASVTV